jgi:hypothetical protein
MKEQQFRNHRTNGKAKCNFRSVPSHHLTLISKVTQAYGAKESNAWEENENTEEHNFLGSAFSTLFIFFST